MEFAGNIILNKQDIIDLIVHWNSTHASGIPDPTPNTKMSIITRQTPHETEQLLLLSCVDSWKS